MSVFEKLVLNALWILIRSSGNLTPALIDDINQWRQKYIEEMEK